MSFFFLVSYQKPLEGNKAFGRSIFLEYNENSMFKTTIKAVSQEYEPVKNIQT